MIPGSVSRFIDRHFQHFNAAALKDAADGYCAHLDAGGRMLLTLAGAMSTAELGLSLAEMIRQGKVHAIVLALSDRRRHRWRLSDLCCADAAPRSPAGDHTAMGLLLPDQRGHHELWQLLRRRADATIVAPLIFAKVLNW